MAADERAKEHTSLHGLGFHQIAIRRTRRIGDRHAFQPKPRPGENPRGNIARDDDTPAGELAAIIFKRCTIAVPIDDERCAEQTGDEQHERDTDIDDRRLPYAHGTALREDAATPGAFALSTPRIFKALPICETASINPGTLTPDFRAARACPDSECRPDRARA